jgi:hypothetical protein
MDLNSFLTGLSLNKHLTRERALSVGSSSATTDDSGIDPAILSVSRNATFGLSTKQLKRTSLSLLSPDYIVPPKRLPPTTEPTEYLHIVQHNVVAEYAAFLAETSDVYA